MFNRISFHLSITLLVLSLLSFNSVYASQKLALVIGNGNYPEGELANPIKDATDVAASLRTMGFEVIELHNATRKQMHKSIRNFGNKLEHGGVGLFYYAGHGVQVEGNNYLIPTNASILDQAEVPSEAISANLVLRKMDDASNGLNIVILDACRNNPYASSFRSATRGLARIEGPTGSIIAYSTSPGAVAFDGEPGQNSLFTRHFLEHMKTPNLPIELMFKRVRISVESETRGKQVPWESSSLKGDFSFVKKDLNKELLQYKIDQEKIAAAEKIRQEELKKQKNLNAKKGKDISIKDYQAEIDFLLSKPVTSINYLQIAETYQAILELDPIYPAKSKMDQLANESYKLAGQAIDSLQFETAKQYLQVIKTASPNYDTSKLLASLRKAEKDVERQNNYAVLKDSAQKVISAPYVKPGWFESNNYSRNQLKSAYANLIEAKKVKPGDKQIDALLVDLDKKYSNIVTLLLSEGDKEEAEKFMQDAKKLKFKTSYVAQVSAAYKQKAQSEPEEPELKKFNNFGGF